MLQSKREAMLFLQCLHDCITLKSKQRNLVINHLLIQPKVRNFVIEGVACQPPSSLQVTPPLQTSLPASPRNSECNRLDVDQFSENLLPAEIIVDLRKIVNLFSV